MIVNTELTKVFRNNFAALGLLEPFFSSENKLFTLVKSLVTTTFFPLQEFAGVARLETLDLIHTPLRLRLFTGSHFPPFNQREPRASRLSIESAKPYSSLFSKSPNGTERAEL